MAWVIGNNARHVFVLLSVLVSSWGWERCEGSGKFRLDVHHVFSRPVKLVLEVDDHLLPEKNSLEYFKVLAHRDRLFRGRGLASNDDQTPVTFWWGNGTVELDLLEYLHYANVSVGTPAKWFLVALDTGSSLFWLPCDCGMTCVNDLQDVPDYPRSLPLNIYSPSASSTSTPIKCSDQQCFQADLCTSDGSNCPYQMQYVSNETSSKGTLVEDVLYLAKEGESLQTITANILIGCGQVQTGQFQRKAAVNGLLGLGLEDYSVPSILANADIASDSFSMCFDDPDDDNLVGRISFGDKGTSDQDETSLIPIVTSYGVNVTGISVGGKDTGVDGFLAVFDSGTSFTTLLEPVYSALTKSFDAQVKDNRRPADTPFEFCYDSPISGTIKYPAIEITMGGESTLALKHPLLVVDLQDGGSMYCLAVVKGDALDRSYIGQNFMAGYRVVFDRERMVLGWVESDCFSDEA